MNYKWWWFAGAGGWVPSPSPPCPHHTAWVIIRYSFRAILQNYITDYDTNMKMSHFLATNIKIVDNCGRKWVIPHWGFVKISLSFSSSKLKLKWFLWILKFSSIRLKDSPISALSNDHSLAHLYFNLGRTRPNEIYLLKSQGVPVKNIKMKVPVATKVNKNGRGGQMWK